MSEERCTCTKCECDDESVNAEAGRYLGVSECACCFCDCPEKHGAK